MAIGGGGSGLSGGGSSMSAGSGGDWVNYGGVVIPANTPTQLVTAERHRYALTIAHIVGAQIIWVSPDPNVGVNNGLPIGVVGQFISFPWSQFGVLVQRPWYGFSTVAAKAYLFEVGKQTLFAT